MIVTVHSAMTPLGMSLLCGFRVCSGTCSTTPVFCSFTIKLLYRKAEMAFTFVPGRHARETQYYEPVLVCCDNCDAGSHNSHQSPALHQDAVDGSGLLLYHTLRCRPDVDEDRYRA